jgi:hypothetical protein
MVCNNNVLIKQFVTSLCDYFKGRQGGVNLKRRINGLGGVREAFQNRRGAIGGVTEAFQNRRGAIGGVWEAFQNRRGAIQNPSGTDSTRSITLLE